MNLKHCVLAEKVEDVGDGRQNIIGTIDHAQSPTFPIVINSISIAVKLEGNLHDAGRHELEIRFVDQDHKVLWGPHAVNIEMNKPSTTHPIHPSLCAINMDFGGISIPNPGTYEFVLRLDDTYLASAPLYVHQGEAQPK